MAFGKQVNINDQNASDKSRLGVIPPQTTNSIPPKHRKSRLNILIIAGVVLTQIIGPVSSLTGYLSNPLAHVGLIKPKPIPTAPGHIYNRKNAAHDIQSAAEEIEADISLTYSGGSRYDTCVVGQNNLKVRSKYNNRCDYEVVRYYGFGNDFKAKVLQLDDSLRRLGWQTVHPINGKSDLEMVVKRFDKNQRTTTARALLASGLDPDDPDRKELLSARHPAEERIVSNLPIASYARDSLKIEIMFAEQAPNKASQTFQANFMELSQQANDGFVFYEDTSKASVAPLIDEITKTNKYVLVIAVKKIYFQN